MNETPSLRTLTSMLEATFDAPATVETELFEMRRHPVDHVVDVGGHTLLVETKVATTPGMFERWAGQVRSARLEAHGIPLLVVPHMSAAQAETCSRHGINWMDMAGNCFIRAPGLFVRVTGQRPATVAPPRQPGLTSTNSLKFVWAALMSDGTSTQTELAKRAGVDQAQASRVMQLLGRELMVSKDAKGGVHPLCHARWFELVRRHPAPPLPFEILVGRFAGQRLGPSVVSRQCSALRAEHALSGPAVAGVLLDRDVSTAMKVWLVADRLSDFVAATGFTPAADGDVRISAVIGHLWFNPRQREDGTSLAPASQVYLDCMAEAVSTSVLASLQELVEKEVQARE